MCDITAVASKDTPKYWLKCPVSGQRHPTLLLHGSLPPTEVSMSSNPHQTADLSGFPPIRVIQSTRAGKAGSRQPAGGETSSYLSTWHPCQNVRPRDIPRAAGLLAKETRRMVKVGACCHRRDNLPKTGDQELPLPLFIQAYFLL